MRRSSRRTEGSIRIAVRLTPRAGVDRVDGVTDGVLRVRVAAPPVDGLANEALLRMLARELDLSPSDLELVSGARGRHKGVTMPATARALVLGRWPGLLD